MCGTAGYFFNEANAGLAMAHIDRFEAFSKQNNLSVSGSPYGKVLGFDMEFDRTEMKALAGHHWLEVIRDAEWDQHLDNYRGAVADFGAVMEAVKSRGYAVQLFEIPLVVDQRSTNSTLISRITGLLDVAGAGLGGLEVPMLYSSELPSDSMGAAFLETYRHSFTGQAIAVGSTGGLNSVTNKNNTLDWDKLRRDLLLARASTRAIFIYSLEGSAAQGHLEKLVGFDWSSPTPKVNQLELSILSGVRKGLRDACALSCQLHPSSCS